MLPYSAFMQNPATMGRQMAQLSAQMPTMPVIPTYQGPVSNASQPSLSGPQIPQPGQGMPATNGVLSQVPGLLKYLQQMPGQNGANSPANTPGNNYFYGMSGGQGDPSMYGGSGFLSSLFGGGANPYAGMGAPT